MTPPQPPGGDSPRIAEATFPGTRPSVAQMRTWARAWLQKFGIPESVAEDAVLVLSELATNAISHTRSSRPQGTYQVSLRRGVNALRVEVTDAGGISEPRARRNGHPGNGHPAPSAAAPVAESGHGLALVEAFSAQWWTRGTPASRTVAADLTFDSAS